VTNKEYGRLPNITLQFAFSITDTLGLYVGNLKLLIVFLISSIIFVKPRTIQLKLFKDFQKTHTIGLLFHHVALKLLTVALKLLSVALKPFRAVLILDCVLLRPYLFAQQTYIVAQAFLNHLVLFVIYQSVSEEILLTD
jgi:hypothetical protein